MVVPGPSHVVVLAEVVERGHVTTLLTSLSSVPGQGAGLHKLYNNLSVLTPRRPP